MDADIQVDGISIGPWWIDLRYHSCAQCHARTCWKPVDGSVCFLDKGHPGLCRPWKDSYGDVLDGLQPITDLWTRA